MEENIRIRTDEEALEALKEILRKGNENYEKELAEVQQLPSVEDRKLFDKMEAANKWEDMFEVMQAMAFDINQAFDLVLCAYGIDTIRLDFPPHGWST